MNDTANPVKSKSPNFVYLLISSLVVLIFLLMVIFSVIVFKYIINNPLFNLGASSDRYPNTVYREMENAGKTTASKNIKITTSPPTRVSTKPPVIIKTQPTTKIDTNCYTYEIKNEELESSGCYDFITYKQLSSSYSEYISTIAQIEWLEKSIEITCDSDWDEFEKSCKEYQDRLEDMQIKKTKLESEIRQLISTRR